MSSILSIQLTKWTNKEKENDIRTKLAYNPDPYADVDGVGGGVWVNFHRRRRRADDF